LIGVDRSVYVYFDTRQVAMIEPRHLVVLSAGTREASSVITSTGIVPTTEYDAFLGESLKLGGGPFVISEGFVGSIKRMPRRASFPPIRSRTYSFRSHDSDVPQLTCWARPR